MKLGFTILLASFNRLDLLKKSVESAINHDYSNFDVLVIDDGSNIETVTWLKNKMEKHSILNVLFQENQGVAKARQLGLEKAKNEYVLILDSDDILLSGYLNECNEIISRNPNISFIYTNNLEIYLNTGKERKSKYYFKSNNQLKSSIFLSPRIPYKHSGTVLYKESILNIGGYDKNLKIKIDIDLILKVLSNNLEVYCIEKPYIKFLAHNDSISSNRLKGIKIWLMLIRKYNQNKIKITIFSIARILFEVLKLIYSQLKFN